MGTVVVLDPVLPGMPSPDYCVHGQCTCMAAGCRNWCWLGDQTYRVVTSGQADPICKPCADRIWPTALRDGMAPIPIGHVTDHRLADGPHS